MRGWVRADSRRVAVLHDFGWALTFSLFQAMIHSLPSFFIRCPRKFMPLHRIMRSLYIRTPTCRMLIDCWSAILHLVPFSGINCTSCMARIQSQRVPGSRFSPCDVTSACVDNPHHSSMSCYVVTPSSRSLQQRHIPNTVPSRN